MKKTLFLVFSGAIVIFSIISICSAPIINNVLTESNSWRTLNCKMKLDDYNQEKETTSLTGDEKDKYLKGLKKQVNLCNRKKAMYGLEYSSLIIGAILGFTCLILGLLHYFDVGKPFEKITGIIGLATCIIGFILTLIYVIYSGFIFTNDIPETNYDGNSFSPLYKADNEGIFATYDSSLKKYKCNFYDKDDENAIYAKYNEMGKKIYNYNKEVYQAEATSPVIKCRYYQFMGHTTEECHTGKGYIIGDLDPKYNDCDNLYIDNAFYGYENKYIYDRWVTTIIFACFLIPCYIGLGIFGFLLFKSNGSGL